MEWLNYHHLFYFWTVVRTGSITKACEELRLAPPTVSAQLKSFEDQLGEKLLKRSEQVCAAMEAKQAIEKHVDQLSAGGRSAFRLRVVGGLSTKEAREVLGVSENVVKSRLLRARVRLAEVLREPLQKPLRETADIAMVTTVGRCL